MILIPDNKTTIMTKEAGRTKIDLNISNNRFKKDLHLMKLVSNIFLHSALVTSVRPSKIKYLFAKIQVAKKKSTGQAGNSFFFFLFFKIYIQTKFSKEQKK